MTTFSDWGKSFGSYVCPFVWMELIEEGPLRDTYACHCMKGKDEECPDNVKCLSLTGNSEVLIV